MLEADISVTLWLSPLRTARTNPAEALLPPNVSYKGESMFTPPPTKKDAVEALQALESIERPYGDNKGEEINSASVYPYLAPEEQELVDHAVTVIKEYLRKPGDEGDEPNQRSLTELRKAGYPARLNADQYDPDRLVGRVTVNEEWTLDVSDPTNQYADD